MLYLRCDWDHRSSRQPVTIYSEFDDEGLQTRKIEILPSGIMAYADGEKSTGNTRLSDARFDLEEAEKNYAQPGSTIKLSHIDEASFNQMWQQATA